MPAQDVYRVVLGDLIEMNDMLEIPTHDQVAFCHRRDGYVQRILFRLLACGAALYWGLTRRQFAFVAYAAVYGYIGVSSIIVRNIHDTSAGLLYFVVTGAAMLTTLVGIARRFGRDA